MAGLFGGMLLFAGGFAAFLFRVLPISEARALIRKAFPPFYVFEPAFEMQAALAALHWISMGHDYELTGFMVPGECQQHPKRRISGLPG